MVDRGGGFFAGGCAEREEILDSFFTSAPKKKGKSYDVFFLFVARARPRDFLPFLFFFYSG